MIPLASLPTQFINSQAGSNRASRRHPDTPQALPRRWASLKQAAEYLGTTDRSVRNYVAAGKFRAYRLNRRLVRVDLNEIDAAMQPFGGDV